MHGIVFLMQHRHRRLDFRKQIQVAGRLFLICEQNREVIDGARSGAKPHGSP